jgi:hypothetical protein
VSALLALVGTPAAAAAPVSLTGPYSENFDTLSNTAGSTTNTLTIPGWELTESGGGARDNEQYAVDTGGSNTGDTYSYGAAGSTERALGGLRSGTLIPIFGASFTNNTGTTIASLAVSYTGEEWRLGTAARTDQLNFEYSLNATDLTTGTWTGVAALTFVTPDTVTTGAKNGNAAGERTALSTTITGLSIPNGATFWIRFTDTDASGADDGLAVDNFSLTPNATTAVEVLRLTAKRTRRGVVVEWRTADESRIAGFELYRERSGRPVKLNRTLIRGLQAGSFAGRSYAWLDAQAAPNALYRLQLVRLDGTRAWYGTVRA